MRKYYQTYTKFDPKCNNCYAFIESVICCLCHMLADFCHLLFLKNEGNLIEFILFDVGKLFILKKLGAGFEEFFFSNINKV